MNISKNVCTGSHCGQRFVWIQQYLPLEARSAWIQQRKCTFCADIPSCGGMPRNFVTNIGINRVRIGGSVPSVPSNAANAANTAPEQAEDDEHEETSEELAKTKSLTSASSRRAALSCTNLPEKRGLQSLKLTQKSLHSKIVALKQKIDRRKRNFNNIQRSRKKIRPVGRSHLLGPAAEDGEAGEAGDVDAVFSEDEANMVVEVNAEDEAAEEEAEEEEQEEEQEQQQAAEAEQAAEAAEAGGVDVVDEDLNLNGDLLLSEEHELFLDRTMRRGANNMVVDSPVYQKTVACKLCGKQDLQSPCSFCNYLLLKYIQL